MAAVSILCLGLYLPKKKINLLSIICFSTSQHPPCFCSCFCFPSWQEGKDKMFLIEKLTKLQDAEKRGNTSSFTLERRDVEVRLEVALGSS